MTPGQRANRDQWLLGQRNLDGDVGADKVFVVETQRTLRDGLCEVQC